MSADRPGPDGIRRAIDELERLRSAALITEAEEAAHGVRYLTVATGDTETAEDLERLQQLTAAAWRGRAGARTTQAGGGSDHLTFRVEGPTADGLVEELAALARQLDPGWWQVRRSAQ